jgi:hypothetical protein
MGRKTRIIVMFIVMFITITITIPSPSLSMLSVISQHHMADNNVLATQEKIPGKPY